MQNLELDVVLENSHRMRLADDPHLQSSNEIKTLEHSIAALTTEIEIAEASLDFKKDQLARYRARLHALRE